MTWKDILYNSLDEYSQANSDEKIRLENHVKRELKAAVGCAKIGFPLDRRMLRAGELFIYILERRIKYENLI